MSASTARVALTGPADISRPEDIAALAAQARALDIDHIRVSLQAHGAARDEERLLRQAVDQAGVSILAHLDGGGFDGATLSSTLTRLATAGFAAVEVPLDACDLLDDTTRAALLKAVAERDPALSVYVSGSLTHSVARLGLLKSSGLLTLVAGVVASAGSDGTADWLGKAIAPGELRTLCTRDVTLQALCLIQQGPSACIYLPHDAPRGLLRLARPCAQTRSVSHLFTPALQRGAKTTVIVGGAGFIGSNLAHDLASSGEPVRILDDLARPGVERNLEWLKHLHGPRVEAALVDIRRSSSLRGALDDAGAVFHFAAQVAVTTSLQDPIEDFDVNARGTLNVLEELRRRCPRAPMVFSSTNKVYGCLEDIHVVASNESYAPADAELARVGVSESRPLDLRTPYGCSKGAADQYVLDYAKSFDLRAAVLRMSCIYGPRQFGTEDQGWVAHFLMRAMNNEPITVYGDGLQVRDILHVADAVDAYRRVLASMDQARGRAFNLGGGPGNAVSLRRLLGEVRQIVGVEPHVRYDAWRSGDQPWFVADTRALQTLLGWRPRIYWRDGLRDLARWLQDFSSSAHKPVPHEPDMRRAHA